MNTETVLLISAPQDFANRFEVESLGLTLCNQADRHGGAGWAGCMPQRMENDAPAPLIDQRDARSREIGFYDSDVGNSRGKEEIGFACVLESRKFDG